MDGLYVWIRSVACYFLFMSVLDQLLPDRKYVKYIRLFGGMILILLVFHPLTGSLHIEERISRYYEEFVFQHEADDLKQEILGMEQRQLAEMIRQYEQAIARDIKVMAEDTGMAVESCAVKLCGDMDQEQFGKVQKIELEVSGGQEDEADESENEIKKIDKIVIGQTERMEEPVQEAAGSSVVRQAVLEKIGRLRRKIALYYDLEETYVEIQIVEREG